MSLKSVAFFIKSVNDGVVSIDNTTYNESITTLVNSSQGAFWIQAGDDNIPDLCTQINTSVTSISGTFTENNINYTITSTDFVGGRPTRRIPH